MLLECEQEVIKGFSQKKGKKIHRFAILARYHAEKDWKKGPNFFKLSVIRSQTYLFTYFV